MVDRPAANGSCRDVSSVSVRVVKVGIVRMRMAKAGVRVPVRMRFAARHPGLVRVLMVLVVPVQVFVLERLMHVHVLVPLADVEPHADAHQRAPDGELNGERLSQRNDGRDRAEERSRREIRAGPCGAERAERAHEEHQTHSVAEEANHRRGGKGWELGQPVAARHRDRQIRRASSPAF